MEWTWKKKEKKPEENQNRLRCKQYQNGPNEQISNKLMIKIKHYACVHGCLCYFCFVCMIKGSNSLLKISVPDTVNGHNFYFLQDLYEPTTLVLVVSHNRTF